MALTVMLPAREDQRRKEMYPQSGQLGLQQRGHRTCSKDIRARSGLDSRFNTDCSCALGRSCLILSEPQCSHFKKGGGVY